MIPPDSYASRSPVAVDCWRPFDVDGSAAATTERRLRSDASASASSVVHHRVDLHPLRTSSSLRDGVTRRQSASRLMRSCRSRRVRRTTMKCPSASESRRPRQQRQQQQQQPAEPTDVNQSTEVKMQPQDFENRVSFDRPSAICRSREFRSDSQSGATRLTASLSTADTSLPADPRHWSKEDVKTWLNVDHGHLDIDTNRFPMNGKALCLMTSDMFEFRVPSHGPTLFIDFRRRLLTAALGPSCAAECAP